MKVMPETVDFVREMAGNGAAALRWCPETAEDWKRLLRRLLLSYCLVPVGADVVFPIGLAIPLTLVYGIGAWRGIVWSGAAGLVAGFFAFRPRLRAAGFITIPLLAISLLRASQVTAYKTLLLLCCVPFAVLSMVYFRGWIRGMRGARSA